MNLHRRAGAAGAIVTILLVIGLISLGIWLMQTRSKPDAAAPNDKGSSSSKPANGAASSDDGSTIDPALTIPSLAAPLAYQMKDNLLEIDISEYAGYAGLIVANGGLEPNPESYFTKQHGFRVKLSISEEENWSSLNSGRFAAAATTADVLAVLGRQFQATVPLQIGFSRGADGVVVEKSVRSVNDLKGKVLAASQFNESEFFIRYLAQEAGLGVAVLRSLGAKPRADQVGLVFCEDAFAAADLFAAELKQAKPRLSGCVSWAPRTDEVVLGSEGKAKLLVSNRNLLVIADVLVVNKGFATANPDKVKGLVHGILWGNKEVMEKPEACLETVAKAFKWKPQQAKDELSKVHLSNLPENLAFFAGTIDSAGSFSGIYQSSVLAYGGELIKDPVDAERFVDVSHLKAIEATGEFKDQRIAIAPIKSGGSQALENSPLLSKDIRFLFQPNSSTLDLTQAKNDTYLSQIKSFLQVSPGSMILLRGHVDNAQVADFRKQGGETLVRNMALKAMELSKQRAAEVRKIMLERYKIDAARIETVGRGWEEPLGADSEQNRRVEVQWFTLE